MNVRPISHIMNLSSHVSYSTNPLICICEEEEKYIGDHHNLFKEFYIVIAGRL